MAKIVEHEVDTTKLEQGAWVEDIPDWDDLRLKVRGQGNRDWKRLQARLVEAVPRSKKLNGRIDPDEMERIMGQLLLHTSLEDWGNLEDAEGNPIQYSKQQATIFLTDPRWVRFKEAVLWASGVVGDSRGESVEEAAKN